MKVRVRRYLGAAVMLLAAPLALPTAPAQAAPVEACEPAPKSPTSLCATYDVQVLAAGTEEATTASQAPFDLRVSYANTSTNYFPDAGRARWLKQVSMTIASREDRQPTLAKTADLPNGLLAAGASAPCVPGADVSFSSCTAGYGKVILKVKNIVLKNLTATFGIHRIYHLKNQSPGHVQALGMDLTYCVDTNGGAPSCEHAETVTQMLTIDQPAAGQPWVLPFTLPQPKDWGLFDVQNLGIDSFLLELNGLSDQLATGPASGSFTLMKLPNRCGAADFTAVGTSETAGSITIPAALTITKCSQIGSVVSPIKLVAGKEGVVSGVVTDYDTGNPVVGATIRLRTCNISWTVPCNFGNEQVQLTGKGGIFNFSSVKLTTSSNMFIRVAAANGNPDQWVMRRINVSPSITLNADKTKMRSGTPLTLSGAVKPANPTHKGDKVFIQRKQGGAWITIVEVVLSDTSTYSHTFNLVGASGTQSKLRVLLPAHNEISNIPDTHIEGRSPVHTVTFK